MSKQTNKVYQVLAGMSPAEARRFQKFMESPYFNQSGLLTRLWELLAVALEKDASGFDKNKVWKSLQPGTKYDDVNFRKHCSDLLKLVENFFVQEHLQQMQQQQAILALEYVVQHKIQPLYNSALRKAKDQVQKDRYKTAAHYYQSYVIERQYYAMMDFDVRLNTRANLEEISRHLDLFYLIEKLKMYIAMVSQRKTGNYEYRIDFLEQVLGFLAKYPTEQVPELALYYYSFLTIFEEENVEHYRNFRRMLDQFGDILPHKEAIELFDAALHYCTGKLNKGDREFMQEHFDIFVEGLRKGIFLVNGELAPWRFNNAVGVALGLGKLDWAEQFVEQYKDALPVATRQNTYAFNLARVYRFQGKYKEVLGLLRDLEYEDIGYNLLSKRMVIMTYYDLDEYDALESFMESFRVFLNRNKGISAQRRRSYLNWLKYVKQLTRLVPGDRNESSRLREEITRNRSDIANHEWLLEKLHELR